MEKEKAYLVLAALINSRFSTACKALRRIGFEDIVMDEYGRSYTLPEPLLIGEYMAVSAMACRQLLLDKIETVFSCHNLQAQVLLLIFPDYELSVVDTLPTCFLPTTNY